MCGVHLLCMCDIHVLYVWYKSGLQVCSLCVACLVLCGVFVMCLWCVVYVYYLLHMSCVRLFMVFVVYMWCICDACGVCLVRVIGVC